jgi:hypothetical protein
VGKGASVRCRAISPETLTYHALLEAKSLHEYVGYNLVARIEMAVLNQLMGTTGLAQNIEYSGNRIESMITFLRGYFLYAQLTDRAGRFPGVCSRKVSKGS